MEDEIGNQQVEPIECHRQGNEFRISPISIALPKPKIDEAGAKLSDGRRYIFQSERMQRVIDTIAMRLLLRGDIFIAGETGTGKDPTARLIHDLARTCGRTGEFVKVDCTTIGEGFFESTLYGHEKGAFTGANGLRKGQAEIAEGGTLYLDEIGELGSGQQIKLLNFLQDRKIIRLGATKQTEIDVLVVLATNRDLEEMIRAGRFRLDLAQRFDKRIELPPLRERREDILLLADYFLKNKSDELTRGLKREGETAPAIHFILSDQAKDLLLRYDFPGNIRELEKIICEAIESTLRSQLTPGGLLISFEQVMISAQALAAAFRETAWKRGSTGRRSISNGGSAEKETWNERKIRHQEETRRQLREALETCNWNIAKAAEKLKMSRQAFWAQLRSNGVTIDRFHASQGAVR
jgi:transcriptional regulator with GAF, ATPase, and Fis domain